MVKTVSALIVILVCFAAALSAAWMMEKTGTDDAVHEGLPAVTPTSTGIAAEPKYSPSPPVTPGCMITITQTDGSTATVPCNPRRIIVANANAAEMVIALGAGDRIVGVTDSTISIPYLFDKIPHAEDIGNWQTPDVEKIISLHPDLVISYSSYKPKNLDMFVRSNITIIYLDCYRLSTLASDARALGKLTGRLNAAETYARMVEDTIETVRSRVKKIPEEAYPDVYFESYTEYTAAAKGSGSDEMLALAGGKNIAGDISAYSAKVSTEWVVSRQPDYVLKVVASTNTQPFPAIADSLKSRQGWSGIPAVKENRIYILSNELQYGPRAYIGLVWIAQLLHPAEFRDLHPRTMLIDYNNRYVSGTNTTTVIYP
ncbi:MAG: Cobalamin-binding protein precursor [Methanoregula sp. PtaU1.Bin051]|nr:MAG: Cobalamin-binding protein precursor [Methanoregula sp. PtaU1.Bin051]